MPCVEVRETVAMPPFVRRRVASRRRCATWIEPRFSGVAHRSPARFAALRPLRRENGGTPVPLADRFENRMRRVNRALERDGAFVGKIEAVTALARRMVPGCDGAGIALQIRNQTRSV